MKTKCIWLGKKRSHYKSSHLWKQKEARKATLVNGSMSRSTKTKLSSVGKRNLALMLLYLMTFLKKINSLQ